jgi:hypothetical protein
MYAPQFPAGLVPQVVAAENSKPNHGRPKRELGSVIARITDK